MSFLARARPKDRRTLLKSNPGWTPTDKLAWTPRSTGCSCRGWTAAARIHFRIWSAERSGLRTCIGRETTMALERQKEVYDRPRSNKMQPVNEPLSGPPLRGYGRYKFEIMA